MKRAILISAKEKEFKEIEWDKIADLEILLGCNIAQVYIDNHILLFNEEAIYDNPAYGFTSKDMRGYIYGDGIIIGEIGDATLTIEECEDTFSMFCID